MLHVTPFFFDIIFRLLMVMLIIDYDNMLRYRLLFAIACCRAATRRCAYAATTPTLTILLIAMPLCLRYVTGAKRVYIRRLRRRCRYFDMQICQLSSPACGVTMSRASRAAACVCHSLRCRHVIGTMSLLRVITLLR